MFSIVLAGDLFVAIAMGSGRTRALLARVLPGIIKVAGIVVMLFGIGVLAAAMRTLMR
ncbi:hypothetical protein ACO229_14115 [Promicromonospora sp. MS192]|uniref:hypothetical protein n=1 Tax=Promicromonospora sp. MS192 TaxID=3412684 RepID=UPI003C2D2B74